MLLGYKEIKKVEGTFREFILETFYNGEWSSTRKVYFYDAAGFNRWLADIQSKCTGPCSVWSYRGQASENTKRYTALEILDAHYEEPITRNYFLYYNDFFNCIT